MLQDEWVVRDVIMQFGGKHEDQEWSMKVICNPFGLYFARCEYGGKVEFAGLFTAANIAKEAGFQKIVSMIGEGA